MFLSTNLFYLMYKTFGGHFSLETPLILRNSLVLFIISSSDFFLFFLKLLLFKFRPSVFMFYFTYLPAVFFLYLLAAVFGRLT
jgi:hypothetical protein